MGTIRRLGTALFVLNLAALWLWVTRGSQIALSYLHHAWTVFLWPDMAPLKGSALPEVALSTAVPGIDVSAIELLHPLERPGGVKVRELVVLNALVRHLQPRRIVEIGTAEGRTTLNLARSSSSDTEILTFDLPPEAPEAMVESGPDFRQLGLAASGALLSGLDDPRVRRVLADSTRYDWTALAGTVDLMFIDGGHDYECVRKDTKAALQIVRPGGVILWHDYCTFNGVTKWLDEMCRTHPLIRIQGTSLAFLQLPER